MKSKGTIISLFDYTGIFVNPWVGAGYNAIIADRQHTGVTTCGRITRVEADLRFGVDFDLPDDVVFVAGFPPCTDDAVSGARHFLTKGVRALALSLDLFSTTKELAEKLNVPYLIEHPVTTISTYAGPANYSFHPYEYGGYLPEDDRHPLYPDYINPRDAYPKKTLLWTGNGFVMPEKKPVRIEAGYSKQFHKLGGKSQKTKNIRSATPRGFAQAVFAANQPHVTKSRKEEKLCATLFIR